MSEAKRYEDWLHTAAIRMDILNSQLGVIYYLNMEKNKKKPKMYKFYELHPMEYEKRKSAMGYINFADVVKVFVKPRKKEWQKRS